MSKTIRWGIVGTGDIAKKFAAGLTVLPDSELVADEIRGVPGIESSETLTIVF